MPSDGCTSTQPFPENSIWSVSPEARPIRVFRFTSVFTAVCTPLDHVIAACGSVNAVSPSSSSSIGGPSESSATHPVPASSRLNSPPASTPEAPSTLRMFQSMPASNASRLELLTVILSSASFTRCTSCAWKARNTSPVPETFIRSTPSPVATFFIRRAMPPVPARSNFTSPW